MESTPKTHKRQQLTGTVVSDKMQKTVVVKIDIHKRHPKYKKSYTVSRRFKAHDEANEYKVGDKVVIESIRPMSKDKKFKVLSKITKA
jgi:small subunit ribosomal protein S17